MQKNKPEHVAVMGKEQELVIPYEDIQYFLN